MIELLDFQSLVCLFSTRLRRRRNKKQNTLGIRKYSKEGSSKFDLLLLEQIRFWNDKKTKYKNKRF